MQIGILSHYYLINFIVYMIRVNKNAAVTNEAYQIDHIKSVQVIRNIFMLIETNVGYRHVKQRAFDI